MQPAQASETLRNVFEACDQPVSTRIDEIIGNSSTISSAYPTLIIVTVISLIITLLLPILLSPSISGKKYNGNKATASIQDYSVENGQLYIDLDGQFLNITKAYAINPSGETIYPREYNIWKEQLFFDYDETEWNIYLEDINGNTVHMLLSPTN